VVAGGPHPVQARALADYLSGADVEARLLRAGFFCASVRHEPRGMSVKWQSVGAGGREIFEPLKDLVFQ